MNDAVRHAHGIAREVAGPVEDRGVRVAVGLQRVHERRRIDVLEHVHRAHQEDVVDAHELLVLDVVDPVAGVVRQAVERALEAELEPRRPVVGAAEDEAQAARHLRRDVGQRGEVRVEIVLVRVLLVGRRRQERLGAE